MANPAYRRQGVSSPRAVSPQRAAPVAQYDPYAPQLGYLSENIHRLLTERECSIFDRGLADYHRRRNIRTFVECLSLVLNTNQKRQLLLPIRDTYIKPTDFAKFNQLVQAHGLATSLRKKKKDEEKSKDVKKIEIKRDPMEEWGLNIRGGAEHGLGIFVSWIDPGSAAQRAGLHAGDQILKANDLNCEHVSHYEAVKLIKNAKKLRLWVLSHGRVPSSHMANKVYRWVDPDGRPTTPPPDPFEVQDQVSMGDHNLMSDADERKVTIMVDNGQELGISIRGGAEHGLGVYVSFIEEGSVAEAYGLKVGDQIIEVNGVNFLGIVHSDAANALRAQPCMVIRIKDVGKLPHSRITTYGQTKWQAQSPTSSQKWSSQYDEPPSPAFRSGVGTQVMLKQDTSIQSRGMMNEVARSVLSSQEVATFNYYVHQYEHYNLPVDDLVTPLLDLFNTKEKIQLIAEVRTIIKPHDLQRYNELTVHKEIAAKKAVKRNINGSIDDLVSKLSTQRSPKPPSSGVNGGRDTVPHKLSPQRSGGPVFHIPPPPSSHPQTSTPDGHNGTDPQRTFASSLQDRRQWMTSGADETDHGQWNETSMMSSIQPSAAGKQDNLPEIEARIRAETETKLRHQFEEQQQKLLGEQQQRLAEERREKELTLSRERETLERQLKEMEERVKAEVEEKERLLAEDPSKASQNDPAEIEERIKQELEEKIWREAEEHMRQEFESKMEQEKQSLLSQQTGSVASEQEKENIEERVRKEVEDKLKREYQEKIRQEEQKWKRKEEEERRRKEEEQKLKREEEIKRLEAEEQARIELEEQIRREAEAKARAEYEARLQHETEERARLAKEVKARKAMEERMEMKRAQQQHEEEEEEEEEEVQPTNEEELEEQRRLEEQRIQREKEKREEERRMAQQRKAAEDERKKKDEQKQRRLELERKREENLRRKEQEKKQREAEEKKRHDEEARKRAQQKKTEAPPSRKADTQTAEVMFGEEGHRKPQTKEQMVADERRKAEEKLQRRLRKAQQNEETDSAPGPPARAQEPPTPANQNLGQSYAGYDNLQGTILNITITKVCKRLGIAIDGGSNTKQKAVIIREISPGGCAAQTGLGMSVGQQVLSVDGQSLYGLKHKDVVMAIKSAFEGPLNKTIDLIILEPED